jgi:hypothetical protein
MLWIVFVLCLLVAMILSLVALGHHLFDTGLCIFSAIFFLVLVLVGCCIFVVKGG